ncbi:hypothetical protein O9992_26235 [Vibrio lentus]|nr:hypothetical protein [Vibrio lentus]
MEKTSHATVIPMDVGWNDIIGSWSAIWDVSDKDEHNNVIEGDVLIVDSQHNYIHAENKLVATVGVENLIIVENQRCNIKFDKKTKFRVLSQLLAN